MALLCPSGPSYSRQLRFFNLAKHTKRLKFRGNKPKMNSRRLREAFTVRPSSRVHVRTADLLLSGIKWMDLHLALWWCRHWGVDLTRMLISATYERLTVPVLYQTAFFQYMMVSKKLFFKILVVGYFNLIMLKREAGREGWKGGMQPRSAFCKICRNVKQIFAVFNYKYRFRFVMLNLFWWRKWEIWPENLREFCR